MGISLVQQPTWGLMIKHELKMKMNSHDPNTKSGRAARASLITKYQNQVEYLMMWRTFLTIKKMVMKTASERKRTPGLGPKSSIMGKDQKKKCLRMRAENKRESVKLDETRNEYVMWTQDNRAVLAEVIDLCSSSEEDCCSDVWEAESESDISYMPGECESTSVSGDESVRTVTFSEVEELRNPVDLAMDAISAGDEIGAHLLDEEFMRGTQELIQTIYGNSQEEFMDLFR